MEDELRARHNWIFSLAALGAWLCWGWPVWRRFSAGEPIMGALVSPNWFVPYAVFGAAMLAAMAMKLDQRLRWALIGVQLAATLAMALILPWAGMSSFLIVTAWQVAMMTAPPLAFGWVAFQTLALVVALAQALRPDICWVIAEAVTLQLILAFAAQALRRQAQTACALAETNAKLRSAQGLVATAVRDAERLRISRELHDAWGHELTALGLQLEIASHLTEPGRASGHVLQAKGLARDLLAKVRDVVSTLREDERSDLADALAALARRVPTPVVHVAIAPGVRVGPDQAHALIRCAQEAVTNAVRHAQADNLWLEVTGDADGVRLVAHDDGRAAASETAAGSGLLGMRERIEYLGGRLAVRAEAARGFTIDAWLPSAAPRPA